MENRNILMVILSVSVLFVIVFGIALLITWPKNTANRVSSAGTSGDFLSWGRGGNPTATPANNILGLIPTATAMPGPTVTSGTGIAIEVRPHDSDTRLIPESTARIVMERPERTAAPAPVKTRQAVERTTVRKATAAPQRITEYWIQSGSFKSKSSAENRNEKLAEKGFPGTIKTRVVNGTTYFRVRIGPYTNKNEAGKFLAWIKEIPEMNDSYISESYVIR